MVNVRGFEPLPPLLAKYSIERYVGGPSSFILCLAPRFSMVFGSKWTSIGPKFSSEPLKLDTMSRSLLARLMPDDIRRLDHRLKDMITAYPYVQYHSAAR
jgi:hypothetical protein